MQPPHSFPAAKAAEQATQVVDELEDAAGTIFLAKVAKAAERQLADAALTMREIMTQPEELDQLLTVVNVSPSRAELRGTLNLR